jgi:hypothetical protein
MLQQRKQGWGTTVLTGLFVALAGTFMACSFTGDDQFTPEEANAALNAPPLRSPSEGERWTVYEAPGTIRVQHGYSCFQPGFAATEDYVGIRLQDMAAVPLDVADTGTVFLNGWDVRYTDGDHHVQGLYSAIFNITSTRTATEFELHWEAAGALSDKNGDDGYRWCYYYTLVFWKRSHTTFEAVPFHYAFNPLTFVNQTYSSSETALLDLPGTFTDPGYGPRAVLPRGFGLAWFDTDHHVLHAGFDLGPPAIAANTISWTAQTLLKDNSDVRKYYAAALVSVLSGKSAQMWQPNTVLRWSDSLARWLQQSNTDPLTPRHPEGVGCVGGEAVNRDQFTIEGVPFDYAVPVLTGWDIGDACSDHHVKQIGVWLEGFEYVKDPNATTGTLLYTIASTYDDDALTSLFGSTGSEAHYRVSVLGLNLPRFSWEATSIDIGEVPAVPGTFGTPAMPVGSGGTWTVGGVMDQNAWDQPVLKTTECLVPMANGQCAKKTCKQDKVSDCATFARNCVDSGHHYAGTVEGGT